MNKKVIKTLIILVGVYLATWYVLKFFFPEEFVLHISNPNLIKVGNFIDNHIVLNYLCGFISSFLSYYLYLGAVCKQTKLDKCQILSIVVVIIISLVITHFKFGILQYYGILAMIILPSLYKANSRTVAIVFSTNLICQYLSLSIRNISSMIMYMNSVIAFLMSLESYAWLLLFYLYFNYNEKYSNGTLGSASIR